MKNSSLKFSSAIFQSILIFIFSLVYTSNHSQTHVDYEPSYAVWNTGMQMGIIEYGAFTNAAPSTLIQNFNTAIAMASSSGCIPTDGLIRLRNSMQNASSSNSLYTEIFNFRQQLGSTIAFSCSCVSKNTNVGVINSGFYPDISGTWYQNGNSNQPCAVGQNGQYLSFQIGSSTSQGYFSSQRNLVASDWNANASLSDDYQTITWNDQTWTKQSTAVTSSFPSIGGTWYQNGNSNQPCTISQNSGYLSFQIGSSTSQGYFTSQNEIFASDWNTKANLSPDGQTLTWGNQTWTRNATTTTTTPTPTTTTTTTSTLAGAETLTVPSNGSVVRSRSVLQAGRSYLIEARGTWSAYGGLSESHDACYRFKGYNDRLWGNYELRLNDKGLQDINGSAVTYSEQHIYRVRYTGEGKVLEMKIRDPDKNWSDNTGSLTVTITPQ